MLITLTLSAAGFALRHLQLTRAFDAAGLPIAGSGLTLALAAVCVLGVLLLLLGAGAVPDRPAFARCFPPCAICFGLSVLAAAAILLGSCLALWRGMRPAGDGVSLLALAPDFLGVFGALCLLSAAYRKYKGAPPLKSTYLVPFFFAALRLVLDFKNSWSSDPVILDYCFELFAMLAAMTALYHLAGFCFDRGKRARTSFWCLTGTVFCVISVADGGAADMPVFFGLALWLLTNAYQLLGPGAREKASADGAAGPGETPAEPEEAPEATGPAADTAAPAADSSVWELIANLDLPDDDAPES